MSVKIGAGSIRCIKIYDLSLSNDLMYNVNASVALKNMKNSIFYIFPYVRYLRNVLLPIEQASERGFKGPPCPMAYRQHATL